MWHFDPFHIILEIICHNITMVSLSHRFTSTRKLFRRPVLNVDRVLVCIWNVNLRKISRVNQVHNRILPHPHLSLSLSLSCAFIRSLPLHSTKPKQTLLVSLFSQIPYRLTRLHLFHLLFSDLVWCFTTEEKGSSGGADSPSGSRWLHHRRWIRYTRRR